MSVLRLTKFQEGMDGEFTVEIGDHEIPARIRVRRRGMPGRPATECPVEVHWSGGREQGSNLENVRLFGWALLLTVGALQFIEEGTIPEPSRAFAIFSELEE